MKAYSGNRSFLNLAFLALFGMISCGVQAASSKGVGEVTYKGMFGPSKSDHQAAYEEARFNAVKRYVAQQSKSQVKLLEQNRKAVLADIDNVILDATIVDEEKNKSSKSLRITVRAEINTMLLESILEPARTAEASYMTFVFVSREQSSVQTYRDKDTSRVEKKESKSGMEAQSAHGGGGEYYAEKQTGTQVTKGGSTIQKADEIQYRVTTTGEINSAMSDVFTENGFEVVDAVYLEDESSGRVSIESFRRDYSSGDDIDPTTLNSAVAGMRDLDISYFALGTLDVGMRDTDPQTGLVRVHVTVTGQVKSLTKRFPKTVASVGPVQYAGLGPNSTVARNNALKLAAEKAATQLTAQLHAKNLY
jgi:hypothetical protein